MKCARQSETERLTRASKTGIGHQLFNVPACFLSSRSAEYRGRILLVAQALATVLDQRALSSSSLLERFSTDASEFIVSAMDIASEKRSGVSEEINRWLINIDRWKPSADRSLSAYITSLDKQIQKAKK
jgi:hypothetical protein